MLPTVAIVPSVSPVVQIKSVDRDVSTVRTTTSVERKNNAVITNASVVSQVVPVRTTPNVTLASNAVIANASVVRFLVPARMTTIVTLERFVVGEFVPHTVVGAVELLQAPLSARSSSPSSFPSYPAVAVLVARTTTIVHPIMWSSPTNNHDKK